MDLLSFFWHFLNFFTPAAGVAVLLAIALGLSGSPRAQFWQRTVLLFGVGALVLVAGLLLQGRDGRMFTYAAMVLAMGTAAAWWRQRRG